LPNALIFSPSFIGHRQVHAFVHAHVLNKIGYNIFIAGNFSNINGNSLYIKKLIEDAKIIKIDTSIFVENGLQIENTEFLSLQKKYNIDLTIFVEADNHIPLLISQLFRQNSRFQGRVVGIFLRPWDFYENLGFFNNLRYIKNLKNTWKSDSDTRFFHKYLNSTFNLLNSSLYLDEYVVSKNRKSIFS